MGRFSNLHLKGNSTVVEQPDTVNPYNFPAYSESDLKQTIAKLALTGVLKNQYYKREDSLVTEMTSMCEAMSKEDPIFLLKAAKVSRDMNMKLFPKIALAAVISNTGDESELAKLANDSASKLLSTYNPNQLLEFVLTMKEKTFKKGLGSRTQKIVSRALGRMGKDRLDTITISEADSLQRILRLVHPKLDSLVKYVLDKKEGTGNGLAFTPRQKAMEALKLLFAVEDSTQVDFNAAASLIKEHKLPFNALKGVVGKANEAVWDAIAEEMSVLQLLINLKALDEKNSMSPSKLSRLLDSKVNDKTRILPFDVMRPYAHSRSDYQYVLSQLIEKLSMVEIPGLSEKDVAVFIDASGSMGGRRTADSPWMNSVALALPFITNCPTRKFYMFDTRLHREGEGLLPKFKIGEGQDNFNKLANAFSNGGTNTGMCIEELLDNKIKVDVVVLITDEQQNSGRAVYTLWKRYTKEVNKNAHLLVINPTSYEWHACPTEDPSVTIVQTLTPAIYRLVSYHGKDVVAVIEETVLEANVVEI